MKSIVYLVLLLALLLFLPGETGAQEKKASNSFGYVAVGPGPEDADWRALDLKARSAMDEGRYDESERCFKEAVSLAEKKGRYDPGVVNCLVGLSLLNHKRGDFKESERLYEYAMRQVEGLTSRDSLGFTKWLPDLAWLYQQHGRPDQAETLHKQILKVMQKEHGDTSRKLLPGIDQYAAFLHANGRHAEASMLETRSQEIKGRPGE
ncbi:MAG: tetratricopeptide repeat protein [Cyanobacteria bacterium HKST-UBA02]|nr:tetratricopeptide repeat protein [Cyanobacteria bacterium HKST-UBA02]